MKFAKNLTGIQKIGLIVLMTGILAQYGIGMYACKKWKQEATKSGNLKMERDFLVIVGDMVCSITAKYGTADISELTVRGAHKDEIYLVKQWENFVRKIKE